MILKIIYLLFKYINILLDLFYNKMTLRINKVKVLSNLNINSRIIVKNHGSILIGKNVTINNSSHFNPVGIPHPTILSTLGKNAEIIIGDNVGISGASIVSAKSIKIGNRVLIGGGVGIWDTDFHPLDFNKRRDHQTKGAKSKPIIIEDDVFIGARVIILKGVTIGKGSVIGAGSLVSRDVPEYSTIMGINNIIERNEK